MQSMARKAQPIIRTALELLRAFIVLMIIVVPTLIGFCAGVAYSIGRLIVIAVVEAFADGQRLING